MATQDNVPQEPTFRQRIRAEYERFSPSYSKVADFLLDEYRTAAFLNASGVAQHLDVDPATVVRFAQRLGYPGYPQLAREIQVAVRHELTAAFTPHEGGEDDEESLRPVLYQAAEDIHRLLVVNTPENLQKFLDAVGNARRVYLLAEGESHHIAALFRSQLRLVGIEAIVVTGDRVEQSLALLGATEADLAISFALDPPISETTFAINAVQQRGIPTYAIVRSHSSAAARLAQKVIIAPQSGTTDEPSFTQHITALTLLSAVTQLLRTQRNREVTSTTKDMLAWWESLA